MAAGKIASAEARRYAEASRALRHFLGEPSGSTPRVYVIGPVRHAARYCRAFGLDVTGFATIVDDQHIAHASRRHGSARTEMQRGQFPLEPNDYWRLPRILGDPDTIDPGESGRRGGPAVIITKSIGKARYRVVVELRMRRRQIAFVSMSKSIGGQGV